MERIGLPRAEFFIWGDDHEYRLRADGPAPASPPWSTRWSGTRSVGALGTPMAFGRTTYNDTPSDLKHYCMARNNLLNLREYAGASTPWRSSRRRCGSTPSPAATRPGSG